MSEPSTTSVTRGDKDPCASNPTSSSFHSSISPSGNSNSNSNSNSNPRTSLPTTSTAAYTNIRPTPTIPENAPLTTNTSRGRPTGPSSTAPSADRNVSRSPSATRFKATMTGLMDKVREAVGGSRSREPSSDRAPTPSAPGEEVRGRPQHAHHHGHGPSGGGSPDAGGPFTVATGRGGVGNMLRSKSPPTSRGRSALIGGQLTVEEERAQSRERARSREKVHASGRGGAGNLTSPSRDPRAAALNETRVQELEAEERDVERAHEAQMHEHPGHVASGRGGIGNIH